MALGYTYYSAADPDLRELRSVVAAAVGGTVTADETIVRDGLSIASWRVTPGDEAYAPQLFGFTHRLTVRFRLPSRWRELEEHNTALMIAAVLTIVDRTGADSVLLFNGEEAILQSVDGEVIFAEDWEGWEEYPKAAAFKAGRRVARLPQPLL
jgi:hypothetical protein